MNIDMTQGSAMQSMLRFAVPMVLGNLLQQCYNVADTLIVGKFLGANALAAVGSSFTPDDLPDIDSFRSVYGEWNAFFYPFRRTK